MFEERTDLAAQTFRSEGGIRSELSTAQSWGDELCHKYQGAALFLPLEAFTDTCLQCCELCKMYFWFTVLVGLAILSLSFLRACFPYFGEDFAYIMRSIQLGVRLVKYKKNKPFHSILDCFLDRVKRHPAKTFVHFEGREYSYGEVDKQSNKVARALQAAARLEEGDTVALFLANEPSYIWIWLGLTKLGCPAALLNFNIRSKSLLHCFSCCGAKVIIASAGKTWGGVCSSVWPPAVFLLPTWEQSSKCNYEILTLLVLCPFCAASSSGNYFYCTLEVVVLDLSVSILLHFFRGNHCTPLDLFESGFIKCRLRFNIG